MEIGDFLTDGGRYEIEGLVEHGRHFQIVRCLDHESGGREVFAKAPIVDPEVEEADEQREQWGAAIADEAELLQQEIEPLPTLVETLEVTVDGRRSPVLVYEPIVGDTLYEFVAKRPPGTIPLEALLGVVREVGEVCRRLHDDGYVFRDLDVRHVIVSEPGTLQGIVGTGNIAAIDERPNPVTSDLADAAYVAPEVRNERSGETLRPAADVYALAAMASYAFTGREPTTAVESPLEAEAYEALRKGLADGLEELVALGLQAVAKHRVTLEEFVDYASETGLATLTDPEASADIDIQPLPEPWAGAEPPEVNRAEQSSLSPGPLISVPGDEGPSPGGDELEGIRSAPVEEFLGERDEEDDEEPRTDETGDPVREVSMVDEQLGESDAPAPPEGPSVSEQGAGAIDWEQRAAQSPLPAFTDLSVGKKVAIAIGLPALAIAIVVVLGLLGVY